MLQIKSLFGVFRIADTDKNFIRSVNILDNIHGQILHAGDKSKTKLLWGLLRYGNDVCANVFGFHNHGQFVFSRNHRQNPIFKIFAARSAGKIDCACGRKID